MVYGSVCSGIEAATVAWHPLGWEPAWFAEVAPFPSAVLAHRYPNVPNLGDLNGLLTNPPPAVDVLIGGTPCQSFSVAGLRGGITDARGNLALAFMALAGLLRPRWVVWENVPGVLSSNGGRDFGSILGALGELGYGYAYRVLDAQYFGLAQRRKRVFVVGHLGDWRRAAAVLFEPDRLRRDSPPSRQARAGVARGAAGGPGIGGRDVDVGGLPEGAEVSAIGLRDSDGQTARSLNAHPTQMDLDTETFIAHTLRGTGHDASGDGTGRGVPLVPVAFAHQTGGDMRLGWDAESGTTPTIQRSQGMAVTYAIQDSRTGHDASEDGTGRGVPLVPVLASLTAGDRGVSPDQAAAGMAVPVYAIQDARTGKKSQNGRGWRDDGTAYTLDVGSEPAVAYQCHGSNVGEMGTLRQGSGSVTGGVPFIVEPIPFDTTQITSAANRSAPAPGDPCHPLAATAHVPAIAFGVQEDKQNGVTVRDTAGLLRTNAPGSQMGGTLAFTMKDHGADAGPISPTLRAGGHTGSHPNGGVYPGVVSPTHGVRRLMPVEMERLQGFPDGHTSIPWRGKRADLCPDGPRAQALGNSMATTCIRWIGENIQRVDGLPALSQDPHAL